jgi:hypothetical protein
VLHILGSYPALFSGQEKTYPADLVFVTSVSLKVDECRHPIELLCGKVG